MFNYLAAGVLCLFTSALVSQTSFALGKTAYVTTCKPGNLGEIVIEPMVYDTAGGNEFDNVPQYNDRNFFDLKPNTKEKLSESLVKGSVIKKEFRWSGAALIGYMEEYARNTLPKKRRTLTEKVPLGAQGHRGPGSVVTMNIEDTTISCEFKTPQNIYTEISVSFYQTESNPSNICSSAQDVKSLRVNWYTAKGKKAVKSADILMSCGNRSGLPYDVSMAKINTIGGVSVDLNRTKELQQPDSLLFPQNRDKLLKVGGP